MSLDPDDIRRANDALAAIPLSEERLRELPVELEQFARAIERVRARLVFDAEVADFATALTACAEPDPR